VLVGSNDRDVLSGRGGDDCLFGRPNDDRLSGGTGADLLDGGSTLPNGFNVADYAARTADLSITLDAVANDGA